MRIHIIYIHTPFLTHQASLWTCNTYIHTYNHRSFLTHQANLWTCNTYIHTYKTQVLPDTSSESMERLKEGEQYGGSLKQFISPGTALYMCVSVRVCVEVSVRARVCMQKYVGSLRIRLFPAMVSGMCLSWRPFSCLLSLSDSSCILTHTHTHTERVIDKLHFSCLAKPGGTPLMRKSQVP
jgi:hypothetical protein